MTVSPDTLNKNISIRYEAPAIRGAGSQHAGDCPCFVCAERRAYLRSLGRVVVGALDWRGERLS